jgi:ABC-type multidrug transport system ATPase subunit
MIRTTGLTKRYGSLTVVDSLDLEVRPGDIYGFLGANGSGKTTTVRMLLGLVLATSGTIELMGEQIPKNLRRVLPRVGALVEGPAAYGHLSGPANLLLNDASGAAGPRSSRADRVENVLAQVGLDGIGKRKVQAYSLGMRQRLGIAATLLRDPELLVLDEPTNGLDPQGIHEIRQLLLKLNADGVTIFLSSHLLAEVEQLCTRVGVLDRGKLVAQDDLNALRKPTGNIIVRTPYPDRAVGLLDGRVIARDGDRLLIGVSDSAAINAELVAAGIAVAEIGPQQRTLEEAILEITGSSADRVSNR